MRVLPLVVASMLLGSSCLVRVPMGGVYGEVGMGPPPAARVEVIGRAPSRAHVWLPGRWAWGGSAWVWRPGAWEYGRPGHGWVPGRWEPRGHRHVWVDGYWRRY
jgi:hypothetical protein